jgi:hypothetical protein
MNCDHCKQVIGLNDEYQWIPYQRTRNIRKEYEYICTNCHFEIYKKDIDNWVCYGCNDMHYYNMEFCYDGTEQYCVLCLTEKRENSDDDLFCDCNICQEINNSMVSLK